MISILLGTRITQRTHLWRVLIVGGHIQGFCRFSDYVARGGDHASGACTSIATAVVPEEADVAAPRGKIVRVHVSPTISNGVVAHICELPRKPLHVIPSYIT